jgi:hypothetical protein
MDVDARGLTVREIVSERDPEALPLVDPEHERLDGIALKPERDRGFPSAGPGLPVLRLLLPDASKVVFRDIHPAVGVVVEKAIQRDLDVDRDDLIGLHRNRRWAPRTSSDGFSPLIARQRQPFGLLVTRGTRHWRRMGIARRWRKRHQNLCDHQGHDPGESSGPRPGRPAGHLRRSAVQ